MMHYKMEAQFVYKLDIKILEGMMVIEERFFGKFI